MRKSFAIVLCALLFVPSLASAQYVDRDDNVRFEEDFDKDEFMLTARFRTVALPSFMLGLFYDEHMNNWSEGKTNFAYGAEFTWRNPDLEVGFSVEYADLTMADGYWRASDDPVEESQWTQFDIKFLSFVVATYWYWDVSPWFAPYVGGGIGPGFVIGEATKYSANDNSGCRSDRSQCFGPDGEPLLEAEFNEPEEEDIPFVLPVLNLTGGMRFTIEDHFVIKLELGFHNYLFAGLNLGGQW